MSNGKWAAEKTVAWIVEPLPPDAPPGTVPRKRRVTVRRQYPTRKDAFAALPYLTAADRRPREGTMTQRKRTRITLRELYDQWEPTHDRSRSTMNCYRSGFRLFAADLTQYRRKSVTGNSGLGEVALTRFGDVLCLAASITELNSGVAITLGGLDTGHNARTSLDHRHGDQDALLAVNLGHSDLFTD
jgi:hypothetical protein